MSERESPFPEPDAAGAEPVGEDLLDLARRAGVAASAAEVRALPPGARGALERLLEERRARADTPTLAGETGAAPAEERAPQADAGPPLGAIGRFQLLEEIGRGGMGIVYRARDPRLDRPCAVKVLSGAEASPTARARLAREARSVARLGRHPNIVPVYEFAEEPRPFIAMELVEGRSLDEALRAAGPLEPRRAADLARRVALALDHAHRRGLVHRDVKPSNILLGEGGEPLVTDFGLVKDLADAAPSIGGGLVGTPAYMPPEQADGRGAVDARSDVYSLGAVLYHCLTGRPPHEGPGAAATLARVLGEEPVPPRRLRRGIPRELETIVLRALEKDPARRHPSAAALAEDLRRFLDDEPILSARTPLAVRIARRARRRPLEAAAFAAVLAAAALAALAGLERRAGARRDAAAACLALDEPGLSVPRRIALASAALEIDPGSFSALWLRGRLRKSAVRAETDPSAARRLAALAEADLSAAIALRPDVAGPYLERALLRRAAGTAFDPDLARAAALDPRGALASYARGRFALEDGRPAAAAEELARAVAADASFADAWADLGAAEIARGEEGRGLAALDRAIALDPGSRPALVARSIVRLRLGDARAALADADRAVRLGVADPAAFAARAEAYRYLDDAPRALADAESALAIAPDHAGALVERGCALALLERYEEAAAVLDRLLARAPDSAMGLLARAFVRLLRGDDAGARADVDAAIARGARGAEPPLICSSLLMRAGDAPGALAELDAAIERAPRSADLLVRRSVVRAAALDLGGAALDLEQARALAPDDPRPLEARARLRLGLGDRPGARDDVDAAIAADARRAEGLEMRARMRIADGDLAGAKADLEAALARHPECARAALGLARVAVRRGDPEAARTLLSRALAAARPIDAADLAGAPELRAIAADLLRARPPR
jgi:tetratricopeptide (TPR) repeat protein